jgi:hypothetical protein
VNNEDINSNYNVLKNTFELMIKKGMLFYKKGVTWKDIMIKVIEL